MAAGSGLPPVNIVGIGASTDIPCAPGGLGKSQGTFFQMGMTTFVCNGVTPVTVAWPSFTANSVVIATIKTQGGTSSATMPNVLTVTPGTGFTIAGLASDTSTYNLLIIG